MNFEVFTEVIDKMKDAEIHNLQIGGDGVSKKEYVMLAVKHIIISKYGIDTFMEYKDQINALIEMIISFSKLKIDMKKKCCKIC